MNPKDAQAIKYFCKCGKALPCLNCLNDDEIKPEHKNQIEPSIYNAWALVYEFDQGIKCCANIAGKTQPSMICRQKYSEQDNKPVMQENRAAMKKQK